MWEIIPSRLAEAMEKAGLNQSELASKVGVKQPSIGRLLSGETKTTRALDLIAFALAVSPSYLKGETDDPSANVSPLLPYIDPSEDAAEIDSINLAYGMGGAYLDSDTVETEKMRFPIAWLRQFTDSPPHLLTMAYGIGDSMEPTISDGDSVLIDRGQASLKDSTGERIWAAVFGGVGVIKRLRPMPNGTVKIMSDNPLVSDDIASDGELFIIGRVVGKSGRL